jgi:hypothetical protein
MSPSSSYQPGFSFLESGSRRGSARSDDDDGGGGGGSSIRTARTSASTTTRAPDGGGGGSYQHQRTCFPSPSLWRGGPSPKIGGGGRKIRRSFSDRLPNNNKPDVGLGKPAHNVLNRGRDLSIRVLKKKMALKVAAAASPQETAAASAAADTPSSVPPTASLRKKKNSFVMVFNRITGSRQPKLSIGSGSGGNVAGGPPPSPGGETTDFLKTFCKMSDTDIVNNWLLGIKDSEDKDAVSSVFSEVAPVPALLKLKNTVIDTTIPSSDDMSPPSNAELAGEAGKMAATVLFQSPLIRLNDVCTASEPHLDDIRKLHLENVIGIASEVQQDDVVTAIGDLEDDFIADIVALKDDVISATTARGIDVITDTVALKDDGFAATEAPEVAIITDLGTLNNDVISGAVAQENDVIAATGTLTDDVISTTEVLKEDITTTGALKDDIVPEALDNDVVFCSEPPEDTVIAAMEIQKDNVITATDLQLDDEMAVVELAREGLKQSLSEVPIQQVSYGVQPFTQQEAEIRELLEQEAQQLLVPHDELATLLNTQHNSDPKFTAEGDTLRRRRYQKRRGFAGEDLFRPIQELSFEWGSSFNFDH